jgi:TPR repeat protein
MGRLFESGYGVEKDAARAFKWFEKASDQGHADAQRIVGAFYERGKGISKSRSMVAKWYQRAADGGNAKFDIGRLYYRGDGVERDLKRAATHFQESAGEGEAKAQLFLGRMYARGEGVPRDRVTAYFWLTLAETEEPKRAKILKENLEGSLSSDEIKSAQERAKRFRPE